jgi:hypothetical protein
MQILDAHQLRNRLLNVAHAFSLSCLFGDDEVAEIGSLFRGSFSPEDE